MTELAKKGNHGYGTRYEVIPELPEYFLQTVRFVYSKRAVTITTIEPIPYRPTG